MLKALILISLITATTAWANDGKMAKRDMASVAKTSTHIVCQFTEPFYSIDMNIRTKTLKVISPMGELMDGKITTERTDEIADVAGSEVNGVWTFNYKGESAKIAILSVNTRKKGSDGMSDKVYDAEGTTPLVSGANAGVGGCNFVR